MLRIKLQYSGEENLEIMNKAVNYNGRLLELLQKLIASKNDMIADLGAGNGYFVKELRELNYKNLVCVEPAQNMQKYLKEFEVFLSMEDIEDCSLDFIYSLNVLEHIENDNAVIEQIYNKLKKGGKMLIYVPAFPCLYSKMDRKVGHYRRYLKDELSKKVERSGLIIEDCKYADFLGFFASLIFKMLPSQSGVPSVKSIKFYDKFIFPLSVLADKITKGKLLGKNLYLVAVKK
ncbi:MAG: class I SAM-dependent methyltransferase [Alphaproteobacteria bacterium]|nr:class I SAM-dependent methyltransferase [Alphaproteobacteria bacterium]